MVHPHRENGDTPRLGVVIVTYNAADFVAECLESLLATNYPNLRIVVVDNASPDNTFDSITNWARVWVDTLLLPTSLSFGAVAHS